MIRALKWVGLSVIFALFGCQPLPPPAPAPTPPTDGMVACPASVVPTQNGVCDSLFTAEGYACFSCPGVTTSCVDVPGQVFCVATCVGEPRCTRLPSEDDTAVSAKKRMKKAVRWH